MTSDYEKNLDNLALILIHKGRSAHMAYGEAAQALNERRRLILSQSAAGKVCLALSLALDLPTADRSRLLWIVGLPSGDLRSELCAELLDLLSVNNLEAAMACIDAAMLEHAPDAMSPEQMADWASHQKPAS